VPLLIGVKAPGVGLVEYLLQFDVGQGSDQVEQWRDTIPDLGDEFGVLRPGPESCQQQRVAGREVVLLWHERRRWRVHRSDYGIDVARHRRGDLAGQPQHLRALLQAPEEQPELHHRVELVQGELE
jgi:hypothetical protein